MKIKSSIWFESDGSAFFGKGRIELLEQIERTGSISKAAKAMKMSYKAAWDAVNEMNSLSSEPIVERATGGRGGGGTRLTPKGREYIEIFKKITRLQERLFSLLGESGGELERLNAVERRLTLQTSARNQYRGRVVSADFRGVECEVKIDIGGGIELRALVTKKSAEAMDVTPDMELFALVKSSWVKIYLKTPQECGLNILKVVVKSLEDDVDFLEAILSVGENEVVAVVDSAEASRLGLFEGKELYAVVDPADIILAR
ncbi:MAG: TOBE domain-containing protein [Hydrogenimonas sp.]|nr:TOBE domain-containing protein [Hydrogenimonas sp.]